MREGQDFLAAAVPRCSYVLGGQATGLVRAELEREAEQLRRFWPSLDPANREFCERKLELLQAAIDSLGTPRPELLERWVQTGLYLGSERAWELYLGELAACLDQASSALAGLDGLDAPGQSGEDLGCRLARVACVDEMMAF